MKGQTGRRVVWTAVLAGAFALPVGVRALGQAVAAVPPREAVPANAAVQESQQARVHVENDGWLDIGVYAVVTGVPMYLGHVGGLSEETFDLPENLRTSDLRLLADPIGGFGHYLTEPLRLSPGDLVDLKVEDDLRFSTFTIRSPGAGD